VPLHRPHPLRALCLAVETWRHHEEKQVGIARFEQRHEGRIARGPRPGTRQADLHQAARAEQ